MPKLVTTLAAILLVAPGLSPAAAQEAGQELSLTGCLAQEAEESGEMEMEMEYLLEQVTGEGIMADEAELVAGEGVDLAPHVGHTVEVTGTVIDEDEDEGAVQEGEEEEEMEEDHLHLRVTGLRHISASCDQGR